MNRARESEPARIVKRAQVNVEAELAKELASHAQGASDASHAADASAISAPLPRARHVTKEARLVPAGEGTPGRATVEVRCSCGEWTRVELAIGGQATERAAGAQR
jgi:hypothetical protein